MVLHSLSLFLPARIKVSASPSLPHPSSEVPQETHQSNYHSDLRPARLGALDALLHRDHDRGRVLRTKQGRPSDNHVRPCSSPFMSSSSRTEAGRKRTGASALADRARPDAAVDLNVLRGEPRAELGHFWDAGLDELLAAATCGAWVVS